MKTKKGHTRTQEEILLSDWLSGRRDASLGYVHRNEGIGIATKVKAGRAFSEALTGNLSGLGQDDLLRKARKTAEHLSNIISPVPVKVSFGKGSGSFNAGGRDITLDTDHFDRTDITAGQKTDILFGYAVHEAAHSLHSDFGEMKNRLKDADHADLRKSLANILEDERIEYLAGERFPGYMSYVGEMKKHLWSRLLKERKASGEPAPTEPVARVVNSLLKAVRFPSALDADEVSENFEELDSIRKVLTPFPMTTGEVWDAVDGIMDIIRSLVRKEMQQQQDQQQGGGSPSGPEDGQEGDGQQPQQGDGREEPRGGGAGLSGKDLDGEIERQCSSSQGRAAIRQAQEFSGNNGEGHDASLLNDGTTSEYVNDDRAEKDEREKEIPYAVFAKPDRDAYQDSRKRVLSFVPAMKKALRCRSEDREYCLEGMPSGKLNTRRLASLATGNRRIFSQSGMVSCDKTAVCVLIDESGSMRSRLEPTRDAAVLLNEAISGLPNVEYYAYGYTTGTMTVYVEGGRADRFALGSTKADDCTPTGEAMRKAAGRLRRHTKSPILMLVLTDGSADNSLSVIDQDRKLRRENVIPVGVGIQTECVKKTFTDWIKVDDMGTFAQQLARLTRERLDKMLVRHDSLAD